MKNWMRNVLNLLKDIYYILSEIKELYQSEKVNQKKLINKHDVIALLNISDSTYRRYVKNGRLQPMKLHGIDMYYKDDVHKELQESRRKGRL